MRPPVQSGPFLWRLMSPIGHRGYDRVWKLLDRVFSSGDDFHTVPFAGGHVELPAFDPYWNRFGGDLSDYEPELMELFEKFSGTEFGFVDGGANLGLWSVVASAMGAETVAVEASSSTFEWLERNAARTNGRFTTLNAALTDDSSIQKVRLSGGSHAGRSIIDGQQSEDGEFVDAVTITDVVAEHLGGDTPLVIKLDVEGVEASCIRSIRDLTNERPVVVAYEDHGKDATHEPTVAAMELDGQIVRFDETRNQFVTVQAISELDAIKVDKRRGYNFFYVSSTGQLIDRLVSTG